MEGSYAVEFITYNQLPNKILGIYVEILRNREPFNYAKNGRKSGRSVWYNFL